MTAATPLRRVELPELPAIDPQADPYADHLLAIVRRTADLASWSDELALAAPVWPDSYHLHPARANVLRTLPIGPEAVVLEIGARAGGLTRWLGEVAAVVDALELDPALAAVAAARTADLDPVQVRVGWIDSVPDEPAYDVIVAVDVLNEIDDHGLTLPAFVERCGALLRPDGLLVMAADNTESVAALLGGRTPRVPVGSGRAATVSPHALVKAASAAGLQSLTLSAFPDHRHAQLLFTHSRLASPGHHLLAELPKFSTPPGPRSLLDDGVQHDKWRSLVADGEAEGHAGAVVLLAAASEPALDDAATFWSVGRAAAQSACNRVRLVDGDPVIIRTRAFPEVPDTGLALRLRPHTESVVQGSSVTHLLMQETSVSRARDVLVAWNDLVGATAVDGSVPWDLIPRNVIVQSDGSMHPIDQEWKLDASDADIVRARGWFWLAQELTGAPTPPAWLPPGTVGSTARALRHLSGAKPDPFWLEEFIDREAAQSALVAPRSPLISHAAQSHKNREDLMALSHSGDNRPTRDDTASTDPESVDTLRSLLAAVSEENEALREKIRVLEIAQRRADLAHRDHTVGLVAESEAVHDRLARAQRESKRHKDRAIKLQKQVTALKSSSTWRIGQLLVRPAAAIRGRARR